MTTVAVRWEEGSTILATRSKTCAVGEILGILDAVVPNQCHQIAQPTMSESFVLVTGASGRSLPE